MGYVWVGSPTPSHIWQSSSTGVKIPTDPIKGSLLVSLWGAHLTDSALWIGFIEMPAVPPGRITVPLLDEANPVPWRPTGYQNNVRPPFNILRMHGILTAGTI